MRLAGPRFYPPGMPLAPLYTVRGTPIVLRTEPLPTPSGDEPIPAFGPAAVFERTRGPEPDEEALASTMQRYRAVAERRPT